MEIAEYGWWMEYGRYGQPARPLFTPTRDEYANGQWKKRADDVLQKVNNSWS